MGNVVLRLHLPPIVRELSPVRSKFAAIMRASVMALCLFGLFSRSQAIPRSHNNRDAAAKGFEEWRGWFDKTYETKSSYNNALRNWLANDELISAHNAATSSFELGHNRFSDLSPEAYARRLGGRPPLATVAEPPPPIHGPLPDSFDWVKAGAGTNKKCLPLRHLSIRYVTTLIELAVLAQ